jgi:hypothetical protein
MGARDLRDDADDCDEGEADPDWPDSPIGSFWPARSSALVFTTFSVAYARWRDRAGEVRGAGEGRSGLQTDAPEQIISEHMFYNKGVVVTRLFATKGRESKAGAGTPARCGTGISTVDAEGVV